MVERLSALIACLALLAGPTPAQNGGLSDPTRPPSAASAAGAPDAAQASHARLQSVLISPDRKLAMIDGRTVALGGRVGDATVVQITETQVTLRRGDELTTLRLYPGVVRRDAPAVANKNKDDRS
jgi:MSHA biogenesis protein MshK